MNKLKQTRLEKNLSTRQLEKLSGVARQTISRIERGESKVQVMTWIKLAKAMNVRLSEVMPDE